MGQTDKNEEIVTDLIDLTQFYIYEEINLLPLLA